MLVSPTHSYRRHRPEQTLLYQLVERQYPEFKEMLSHQGKSLPYHVEKEFDEFLKCGRLEHGFLRVVCDDCKHQKLVAFSCKREVSAQAVALDVWQRVRNCWWMMFYKVILLVYLSLCVYYSLGIQKNSAK
ncbi:transposase zinc-binding domain-containing protein [Alteromonas sp. W409]|uniref:Transposase zinc-binding domain-containing protein n=1 Tax=Brumicola blandensis TaxID=3075611 RepID=A0AAW8R5M3_9ALTE|nr:transposase zinc-binding domain-containing protein [Alteromonas sp. W409]MDT0583360.1 transposase zinc-binding domain-containing protein [Alteromonas sp. W409]